jgi:hypothetical protein
MQVVATDRGGQAQLVQAARGAGTAQPGEIDDSVRFGVHELSTQGRWP